MAVETRAAAAIAQIKQMANDHFQTPEIQYFLATEMTPARARVWVAHQAYFVRNRRDCWALASSLAPLDVKRRIWKHEEDELILDPRAGTDHSTLSAREAETLGMTPEEFQRAQVVPGAIAAFYAWIHLSKDRPWLEAFTASSMLERRNDDSVIQGGGLSRRIGYKMANELGIPLKELTNSTVHMDADLEHSKMLERVAEQYATTEEGRQAMLRGARETYVIDRAFRGAVAEALEDIK